MLRIGTMQPWSFGNDNDSAQFTTNTIRLGNRTNSILSCKSDAHNGTDRGHGAMYQVRRVHLACAGCCSDDYRF
jgi:hypothetical protein